MALHICNTSKVQPDIPYPFQVILSGFSNVIVERKSSNMGYVKHLLLIPSQKLSIFKQK